MIAHDDAAHNSSASLSTHAPSLDSLHDAVVEHRAALRATLNQVAQRATPAYQSQRMARVMKLACADAQACALGKGLPADSARKRRAVTVLVAGSMATAATTAGLVLLVRKFTIRQAGK